MIEKIPENWLKFQSYLFAGMGEEAIKTRDFVMHKDVKNKDHSKNLIIVNKRIEHSNNLKTNRRRAVGLLNKLYGNWKTIPLVDETNEQFAKLKSNEDMDSFVHSIIASGSKSSGKKKPKQPSSDNSKLTGSFYIEIYICFCYIFILY